MATDDDQAARTAAASGWARRAARATAWLEPATEQMPDAAGVAVGGARGHVPGSGVAGVARPLVSALPVQRRSE